MKEIILNSIEDLPGVVDEILETITAKDDGATVVCLTGDLGAGKTTFVQHLARELAVPEPVTSPTFTIMKRYDASKHNFNSLVHMDAYRLEGVSELEPLQFSDLLKQPQTLVCIEWGERIIESLPKDVIKLTFTINDENKHTIQKVQ